jgi:hypothetical protein
MFKYVLGANSLAFATLLFGQSDAVAQTGSVHGWNTVDHLSRSSTPGETVNLRVSATGSGTNKLTVKVQYLDWELGNWVTLRKIYVSPGSTSTTTYTVPNDPDHSERIRYRISRKIGTKRINYTVVEQ